MKTKVIGFRVSSETFKKYKLIKSRRSVTPIFEDAIEDEYLKIMMFEEFLKDIDKAEETATEIYSKLKGGVK